MSSSSLIAVALKTLSTNESKLAAMLGVPKKRIEEWKFDVDMPIEHENHIRQLTGIHDMDPEFLLLAGSLENAEKWFEMIDAIARVAEVVLQTEYVSDLYNENSDILAEMTFRTLNAMGVAIPEKIPADLENWLNKLNNSEFQPGDDPLEALYSNPISALIFNIFTELNGVAVYVETFIHPLMHDEKMDCQDLWGWNITTIAASKLKDANRKLAPNFDDFKAFTITTHKKLVATIKNKAVRAGIPLKAELLDLVYRESDTLLKDVIHEREGNNETWLHPDIYVNEQLVRARANSEMLAYILSKIDVNNEFGSSAIYESKPGTSLH